MGRIGWALLGLVTNSIQMQSFVPKYKYRYRSREPSSRRRSTLPAGLVSTREGTQVRKPLLVANWQSDLVVHKNNSLLFDLPHVLLSTQRSRRFTRTTRLTTKPQWIVFSGWSRGRYSFGFWNFSQVTKKAMPVSVLSFIVVYWVTGYVKYWSGWRLGAVRFKGIL